MNNLFGLSQSRVWLRVLSTAMLVFIYACGSGGGGGTLTGGTTGPSLVTYTGKTALADITPANATHVLGDMNNSAVQTCTTTGMGTAKAIGKKQIPQALFKELVTITRL
jgi:hypothetical protein